MKDSDLDRAKALFEKEGIPFPPIPDDLVASVKELKPWVFGTRVDAPSPYALSTFGQEAETTFVDDYLIFGHDGHGTNSWAMHYYLVRGCLALFIQTAWGGIYTNSDNASQILAYYFSQAAKLITLIEEKEELGKLARPQRLIVVVSDFIRSSWKLSEIPETSEEGWEYTLRALEEAINFVSTL
jgi:hypothetical protein